MKNQDASPQVGKGSKGHTEVAHEIMEALYSFPLPAVQLRIILFILRDSYGWKRKETMVYNFPQIAEAVSADRTGVFRAFAELKKKGIIQDGPNGGWIFMKNYNAWGNTPELPLEHQLTEINGGRKSTEDGGQESTKSVIPVNIALIPVNLYRRNKGKKEKKGEQAPAPQVLPNGKKDTPTERARLGSWEHAPQDHPGFTRLSFPIQTALAEQWRETAEAERKRTACKKCQTRPRASDAWAYCRPCTVCRVCHGAADGTRKFQAGPEGVICTKCVGDLSKEF